MFQQRLSPRVARLFSGDVFRQGAATSAWRMSATQAVPQARCAKDRKAWAPVVAASAGVIGIIIVIIDQLAPSAMAHREHQRPFQQFLIHSVVGMEKANF